MAGTSQLFDVPWSGTLSYLHAALGATGYLTLAATSIVAVAAYKIIYALHLSPLRSAPGPFLARLTSRCAELFGVLGVQASKGCEEYEKYGDMYVYHPCSVSISNPADIRVVFGSHAFRKSYFYKGLMDPQLATMKRRQIGPYFSHSYLARMEPSVVEHGILAIKDRWDKLIDASTDSQAETSCHKDFLYASFDIIGVLAFGRDFGALKNDDPIVEKWLSSTSLYFGLQTLFPLLSAFPFSLLIWPYRRVYRKLLEHSAQSVAMRRDLLAVHAEALLMLIAGSKTYSNTLMWTIHLLMLYPEHYRQAVDEVRSLFDKNHLVTFNEARTQLPYFEACIYESIRIIPWPRIVPEDGVTLSGHFLPAGTEVNVNGTGANYNARYWKEPHLFDPERFINSEEAKRNVFTFSAGMRICPGKHLAWIEVLTIMANILKDYDIALPASYTLCGPNALGKSGYPKLMDSSQYIETTAANAARDCRLVISKCN
ncbi:cytochrome P450 [Martensiomyces pterosporus]|nr:cytochrome P450 [Martensiomyces pterosporus]